MHTPAGFRLATDGNKSGRSDVIPIGRTYAPKDEREGRKMSSAKITVDDYRGKGRCNSESVEGNECRRLARCSVTIESVLSNGTTLGPATSALCWDCEDRVIANYTREFRSELGRCYFGSLTINGNEIKR